MNQSQNGAATRPSPRVVKPPLHWSHRVAIACALVVAGADLAQPLLLSWRPKFIAALCGALLYSALAWAVLRYQHRVALWVLMLMPLVPFGTLTAVTLGASFPVDDKMLAIAAFQLLAGLSAACALRRDAASRASGSVNSAHRMIQ